MAFSGRPRDVTLHSTQPAENLRVSASGLSGNTLTRTFAPLPLASRREIWLWFIHRRQRLAVRGCSMLPALVPGDEVFLNPAAYTRTAPQVGDVVMAQHPSRDELILKRITHIAADGRLFLRGDNPMASTDSRSLGLFDPSMIRGRVTCLYSRR